MNRRMTIMLIGVGILFGSIFLYKAFQSYMIKKYLGSRPQAVVAVSAIKAQNYQWQPQLKATGSVRAVRGINVTTEIAGMVKKIYFTPGAHVKEGDILVQLNVDAEIAQLNSLQATAELAKVTYHRNKAQFEAQAVSKATLDFDAADLKSKQAQVAQQSALIAKKTIRAPFTGKLGISLINPGQFVNPGDKVVSLQSLDPIYVDFYIPQQAITQLTTGQTMTTTLDAFPDRRYDGKITTIDPHFDTATRNVVVEATLSNPKYELMPGMFTNVTVQTGTPKRFLTLPQTAISFNPYGDIVYVIKQTGKDKNNKPILIAKQTFVTTGEVRGDQVAILQGVKEGELVVTSGQVKLKNGSPVTINNAVTPANNPAPKATDE